MRKVVFVVQLVLGALGLPALATVTFNAPLAHEEHKMECNETSINAMNADIQAMGDGDAKTTAMKEMQMAKDMLTKKDLDACMEHMHKAMEAIEE